MWNRRENIAANIDWIIVALYLIMILLGWLNIYAAVYNEDHQSIFDISQKYGKQLIWISTAFALAFIIMIIDASFYVAFSYPIYALCLIFLVLVLFLGTEVSGSKSWFRIGEIGVQPAEFAKFGTCLALSKYLSRLDLKLTKFTTKLYATLIIAIPAILIVLEEETGVALVFSAFVLMLYREGLSGNFLLIGILSATLFIMSLVIDKILLIEVLGGIAIIVFFMLKKSKKNFFLLLLTYTVAAGTVYGTDYAFSKLEPHQKKRINVFLGKEEDKKGAEYNVNQAKIAIGSGGFWGKGYLEGTQTKYDFVPEQETDFIFCTIGEEWGFVGSIFVICLFLGLIVRIIYLAERQRSSFGRIYGYGLASIIFFHFVVNIGMNIGLAPVIGIPLPFFSYGGSSLWSFTILLFIFLKLDANRLYIFR